MTQRQHLEIQLEEIGEHSWLTSLLNTLGGSHGSAQLAEKSWEELDHRLVADGWTPETGSGAHWWSRAYTRLSG